MRARTAVAALALGLLAATSACSRDEGPTRVLLVGDSVMRQVAAPLSGGLGPDVRVRDEAVSGSGLLTPDRLDWGARLRTLLERTDPDVVVFLFVGNYRLPGDPPYRTDDGHPIADRSDPAFLPAWRSQADRLTSAADDAGADLVWVLPPPMGVPEWNAIIPGLRDAHQAVADEHGATVVDADAALADRDGGLLEAAPESGEPLRSTDGVHLAAAGAARLATVLRDSLRDCCL